MIIAILILSGVSIVLFAIILVAMARVKMLDNEVLYFRDLWIEKQAELEQMLRDGAIDMSKLEPVGYWQDGKFIRTDGGIYAEKK